MMTFDPRVEVHPENSRFAHLVIRDNEEVKLSYYEVLQLHKCAAYAIKHMRRSALVEDWDSLIAEYNGTVDARTKTYDRHDLISKIADRLEGKP